MKILVQIQSYLKTLSKKNHHKKKKGWWSGSGVGPEFKCHYCKRKKKKEERDYAGDIMLYGKALV
jgi:hypothetical protein